MELVELNENEFETFAYSNPLFSFHQTKEWAKLKKYNGWDNIYLGYKDNSKIIGACLILRKKLIFNKQIWYSPRGFLIDYKNKELLTNFTKDLKKYSKKNGAVFIKIDPYILYKQRDINGDLVVDGIDNSDVVDNLVNLGYKHYGFNIDTNKELQPRWIYVLDTNKNIDDIYNDFSNDTKRYINRCLKQGLVVEEITNGRLDDFKSIMEHTSERRGFINRPMSYYKEMISSLDSHIKILGCYMDTSISLKNIEEEFLNINKEKEEVLVKLNENPDSKKSKVAMKEIEKKLADLEKKKEDIMALIDKYGTKILMASSMFIIYPNEVIYLYSGSFDYFMKYNPQYLIQWEIIKYTVSNNIGRYNFYGIDGDFSKDNKMYGVYEFKKSFNGYVIELVGEFDLIVNKFYYFVYKFTFAFYKRIKKVFFKIRGEK